MLGRAAILVALAATASCKGGRAPAAGADAPAGSDVLITDPSQREAAVGREVTVVGVQTRTKIPTVCGVDVDGDFALSDKRVIARGILRRVEESSRGEEEAEQVAKRSPGIYFVLVDPRTGTLARTTTKDD